MNDQLDDQLRTRLVAASDPVDDSDWRDVRERAHRLERADAAPARRGSRAVAVTGDARVGARRRSGNQPRPRTLARLRRVRSGRLVAACVVAAAAVTGVVELVPQSDQSARVLGLDAVAALAAAAPSTVPDAGEYAYVKRRYGTDGKAEHCTQEWWIAGDGSGRVRQRGKLCTPPLPIARGTEPQGDGLDVRFGPGQATELYVKLFAPGITARPDGLPTDPSQLESELYRTLRRLPDARPDAPASRTDGMLQMIEQVLANPLSSPALRAALYRVAEGLAGVTVNERVTDPEGRVGTAIAFELAVDENMRVKRELIFDPETSASLASRVTATSRATDYRATDYHSYLERATVDSLGAHP